MKNGPRLTLRGNLYIRVEKFPVPLIYNMTYLPESLILHESYINSAIKGLQRYLSNGLFTVYPIKLYVIHLPTLLYIKRQQIAF